MKIKASILDLFRGAPDRVERDEVGGFDLPDLYPTDYFGASDAAEMVEVYLTAAENGEIGRLWELYERMEYSDPFLGGLINHLVSAVAQQPVRRVYKREGSIVEEYEAKLSKTLDRVNLREFISLAARAHLNGAAIILIDWRTYERDGTVFAYPSNIRPTPNSAVVMITDQNSPHYGELALQMRDSRIVPISTLPRHRVIVARAGNYNGRWHRAGALRKVVTWWATKQWAHRRWVQYAELYGTPYRLGRVPATASPKMVEEVIRAVKNVGAFAWAVLRGDSDIEIKEANHPPNVQIYESIIDYAHLQYAVALIGSADVVGDNREGSYARLRVSNSIRYEFIRSVAAIVEDALTELAAVTLAVNMGERFDPLYAPEMKLRVMPPTDMLDLARTIEILNGIVDLPEDYIKDLFNIPD